MADREARVTARVESSGDDSAFRDLATEIRDVKTEAADAQSDAAALGKDLEQAGTEASGMARAADEAGKSVDRVGKRSRNAAADVDRLEREVKETKRELRAADRALDSFIKTGRGGKQLLATYRQLGAAIAGIGITAAALKLGNLVRESTELLAVQEQAVAQLETALANRPEFDLTSKQLQDLAASLQRVTTTGDEVIIKAESILLTFTKINADVFPETIELALDLSERMGTDLQSALVQVGKALNDPIKGVSALAEAGIQFTDTQREQIANLVESNDLLGAQKIILAELETQFGGSARAAREAFGGQTEAVKNAVGDLKEAFADGGIGQALQNLATDFLSASEGGGTLETAARNAGRALGFIVETASLTGKQVVSTFSLIREELLGFGNRTVEVLAGKFEGLFNLIGRAPGKLGEQARKIAAQLDAVEKDAAARAQENGKRADEDAKKRDAQGRLFVERVKALFADAQSAADGANLEKPFDDLGESAEKNAEKAAAFGQRVSAATTQLRTDLGLLSQEGTRDLDALSEALKDIAPGELNLLPPEAKEKAAAEIREIADAMIAAGKGISPELVNLAGTVGVLLTQLKPANEATSSLAGNVDSLGQSAQSSDLDALGEGVSRIGTASQESAGQVGAATGDMEGSFIRVGDQILQVADAASNAGESAPADISKIGDSAEEAGEKAAGGASKVGTSFEEAGEQAAAAGEKIKDGIGTSLDEATTSAEKAGTEAGDAAEKVSTAFADLDVSGLAKAVELLDQLPAKATAAAGVTNAQFASMKAGADAVAKSVQAAATAMDQLAAKNAGLQSGGGDGGGGTAPVQEVA